MFEYEYGDGSSDPAYATLPKWDQDEGMYRVNVWYHTDPESFFFEGLLEADGFVGQFDNWSRLSSRVRKEGGYYEEAA